MVIHEQYHNMPQLSIECNSFLVFRIVSQEISGLVKVGIALAYHVLVLNSGAKSCVDVTY